MTPVATELGFLLELLLDHKIGQVTKAAIAARMRLVEAGLNGPKMVHDVVVRDVYPSLEQAKVSVQAKRTAGDITNTVEFRGVQTQAQSPSTLAAMARHAIVDQSFVEALPSFGHADRASREVTPAAIPQQAVAVTSAAQDAMATRNKLIAEAQAGIAKKGPAIGRGHGSK